MENMLSLWSRNVSRLLLKLRGGNHVVKKINNITKVLAFVLVLSMVTTSLSPAYAGWRSSKTAKKNGYTLGAYANLPYWADKDGGGDWKTKTPKSKTKTVNANGYVYGTGFCLYLGLISTASFTSGNTYYSISTKI